MNFVERSTTLLPRIIKEGDIVITYEGHTTLDFAEMKSGSYIHNRWGAFRHDDIIGTPFGCKHLSFSEGSNQHLYILEPTPELWSVALKTRTQIVDEMDASYITFMLNIRPGSVVVESGTGSGNMTLSLARAVNHSTKAGHVYTYEYNPVRAEAAREEFRKMGLEKIVTVQCQDVCAKFDKESKGGFPGVAEGTVDAVFLDLPEPWHALPHALALLKPNSPICCYSPCIGQVIETCAKLRELGFHSIRMAENKQRTSDARVVEVNEVDLGEDRDGNGVLLGKDGGEEEKTSSSTKKRKLDSAPGPSTTCDAGDEYVPYWVKKEMPKRSLRISKPNVTMKGHTAFLTFAFTPVASSTPTQTSM